MKRIAKVIVTVSAAMCIALPFTSCNGSDTLDSPTGFGLDENYNLTWSPVVNARSYLVDIKNVATGKAEEATSRRENIDLSYLETGDYDIRIRAVGDGSHFYDSDWSAVISFNRAYESGCTYRLINNGMEYEVASAAATATEIILEDVYRGKPVTGLGINSFRNAQTLESVTVGKNVKSIGDGAFYNCVSLKSVSIPDSVTSIGIGAFQSCKEMKSFTVPEGVTALSKATFAYCKGLKEVDLKNVTEIGDSAFTGCDELEAFTVPDQVISIGENAFANAGLKEVTLGSGLVSIGMKAFQSCLDLGTLNFSEKSSLQSIGASAFYQTALTSVELPQGLESIGSQAFAGSESLQTVSIPDSVTIVGQAAFRNTKLHKDALDAGERLLYVDKWLVQNISSSENPIRNLYDANPDGFADTEVIREDTVGIADKTFTLNKDIEDVKLSKNVKYLGASAFNICSNLYRFDASESALEIVDIGAFAFCPLLEMVVFNNDDPKLKEIGSKAFIGCEKLNYNKGEFVSRFIPLTVEKIGSYAFKDTALYKNADEYGVIYADDWVVGCQGSYEIKGNKLQKPSEGIVASDITLDEDVRGIADYAFFACCNLETVTNSTKVEIIGRGAFSFCVGLTGFALTSNVRKIDDFTFYNCLNLMLNRLPSNLRSIGRSAFYNCEQLQSVEMPSHLEEVGIFAFYGCKNLTSLTFNGRLTEINPYAFYGCERLVSVTIPANIKSIGKSAFSRCEALEEIVFEEGVEEIGAYAFRSAKALAEINLPDSVKTIGKGAFLQCENVEAIDLGRVEYIGDFAFAENLGVKSLVVPDSVKTIGKGAFYYLGANAEDENGNKLGGAKSVIVCGSPETVAAHAFYGCNFTTFYMDDENRSAEWGSGWNSSRRPVVWGVTLSEDNTYVVSVTVAQNTFDYYATLNGLGAPYREGYEFAGWSLSADGTEIAYTVKDVMNAPVGTTLYAVYVRS